MMTSQEMVFKVNGDLNDSVKSYSCPNFNTRTVPNDDVSVARVKFNPRNLSRWEKTKKWGSKIGSLLIL